MEIPVTMISTVGGLILAVTTARSQDRFPIIPPDRMTPAQARVAAAIVAGPRKSRNGPFHARLRSPELAAARKISKSHS